MHGDNNHWVFKTKNSTLIDFSVHVCSTTWSGHEPNEAIKKNGEEIKHSAKITIDLSPREYIHRLNV